MGFRMSLRLALTCSVCQREMDDEQARSDLIRAKLFGAAKYSICCNCGQEMPREEQSSQYRRRWTLWLKKGMAT